MKKYILIANIGNRNLLLRNRLFDEYLDWDSFKDSNEWENCIKWVNENKDTDKNILASTQTINPNFKDAFKATFGYEYSFIDKDNYRTKTEKFKKLFKDFEAALQTIDNATIHSKLGDFEQKFETTFGFKIQFSKYSEEINKEEYAEKLKEEAYHVLELAILSSLLDDLQSNQKKISHIYLFVSDQKNETKEKDKEKDTIHAGELVKSLILRKYKKSDWFDLEVSTIPINANVTKVDPLAKEYKRELLQIKSNLNYQDHKIIICDSGGTPQQKSTLKLLSEFIWDKDNCDFYQVTEKADTPSTEGKVDRITDIEYKKISYSYAIQTLINNGNYEGAALICKNSGLPDSIQDVLDFYKYRSLLQEEDIKTKTNYNIIDTINTFKSIGKFLTAFDIANNFNSPNPNEYSDNWNSVWINWLSPKDFLVCCEIYFLADFYLHQKINYTQVAWLSQVFIEQLLGFIIKKSEITHSNNWSDELKINWNTGINYVQHLIAKNSISWKRNENAVPCKYAYCREVVKSDTISVNLVESFADMFAIINSSFYTYNNSTPPPSNERGLDKLRNPIAHAGKGVEKLSDINEALGFSGLNEQQEENQGFKAIFKNWANSLGISNFTEQNNPYLTANQEIQDFLKTQ